MMFKNIVMYVGIVCVLQLSVPVKSVARPAKLEISNGLGISLYLLGTTLFGAIVAFSPKSKRGVESNSGSKSEKKTSPLLLKTAEEMKKELNKMRGRRTY